jgi:hypothetical protein
MANSKMQLNDYSHSFLFSLNGRITGSSSNAVALSRHRIKCPLANGTIIDLIASETVVIIFLGRRSVGISLDVLNR